MSGFPSMKAGDLLRVLTRELGYVVQRQSGSHRVMTSETYPRLVFSFHDRVTVGPVMVRKVLVKDVGLTDDEALELLR